MIARLDDLLEVAQDPHDGASVVVELRDGSHARLRPILPADRGRLVAGFDELSARTRYLRFHAPLDHLTEDQVRYLTEIDYDDHFAWVALAADEPGEPGMGVARYVRLHDDPTVAEAAITVVDRYQGRGLGTLLLGTLAATARAHGIGTFRNYVLDENEEMLELFGQLGATREELGAGVCQVDFQLPEDPRRLPDTPAGRALRAFAGGRLRSWLVAVGFPPVWLYERRNGRTPPPDAKERRWRERGQLGEWLDAALEEGRGDAQAEASERAAPRRGA